MDYLLLVLIIGYIFCMFIVYAVLAKCCWKRPPFPITSLVTAPYRCIRWIANGVYSLHMYRKSIVERMVPPPKFD